MQLLEALDGLIAEGTILTITKGSNIELSCHADSQLKWFHKPSKFSLAVNQFSSESIVHISDVKYINTGFYYCYGHNELGKNVLAQIFVYIYGEIQISNSGWQKSINLY